MAHVISFDGFKKLDVGWGGWERARVKSVEEGGVGTLTRSRSVCEALSGLPKASGTQLLNVG